MLTPEQHRARSTGIGGSDLPALLGLDCPGGKTIADVWVRKRRGPNLELDPIVEDWDEEEEDKPSAFAPYLRGKATDAGSVLEAAIADLYTAITGLDVARCRSLVGRRPWMRCNVDRVTGPELASRRYVNAKRPRWAKLGVDRGLEIKLVGGWVANTWPDDGVPDYVRVQCQWYMGITGLPRWDVMALLGGTDPRIIRLDRDEGLIAGLEDVAKAFWVDHVLANVPPPVAGSPAQAMAIMRAISPEAELEEVEDESPEVVVAMAKLVRARQRRKAAEEETEAINAALAARCGRHAGITGGYGSFRFKSRRGSVDWKSVAHALAPDGVVPDELLEAHRRPSTRVAQGYPSKKWITNVLEAGHLEPLFELVEEGGDHDEAED